MKLYCVRHGEAARSAEDSCCQLTVQGQKDVSNLAHYLSKVGLSVDHLIHSGKLRAQQTAEILVENLQITTVTVAPQLLDCEASVEDLLQMINFWSEDTMLVGHLPFLPQLINALVLGGSNSPILHFPPATIVCLERSAAQQWLIRWALNPEIVPQ